MNEEKRAENRSEKLQSAAEIISRMDEAETKEARLVALAMRTGYELGKLETQTA